ncbi:MAG: hypothetical protein A3D31_13125 [Candidatus Fluviicola riflensis]|nr:MAG: hypothetical protein CHH17_17560 [Candidatus Fluviicola riflensis]OGS77923.1 MAG: hypothetical protein A3D31_13125 [Candidatus Fluviicola riflensis]OGS84988.1 MAG: hypothetical protein A2724_10060 [Fluviicola sp. RIFCSPHIGHO2_01_FULL_43_53]OGS89260.1 MAG: hypothetical protein A3E30_04365 [Fluviicola sp. RIFCSPHIGHO2_12_FULL_43_24]
MDMQALIEEMSALIVKIKSGVATQGELEAFAAAASELNERAIILRYKSYEAKIFGVPAARVVETESASKVEEVPVAEPQSEIIIDAPVDTHTIVQPQETVSETEADDSEVSFDLFSIDNEDVDSPFMANTQESVSDESVMAHSDESESKTESEEPIAEHSETKPEPHGIPVTPEMPEDGISAEEEMEAPIPHDDITTAESHLDDPLMEYPEEAIEPAITHHENPVSKDESSVDAPFMAHSEESKSNENEPTSVKEPIPSGEEHPVYKRLSNEDNSLAARLMAVRLETLKGAFGFNERLQIIKELFDGSNDEFAKAIEQLDSLDSKTDARNVVSKYARQYAWDKDSNLALEFVQKVERRYA